MFIHREPCWVEIALDASALPLALAAWSKPASVLLNASESFRSVTAHRERVCEVRLFSEVVHGTQTHAFGRCSKRT